jgi:DNA-binding NarL/FixJ family response regulator
MERVRALLADDQQEILKTVSRVVDGELEIVDVVQDGEQVIEAVARLDPDLLVLDISMPVLNGFETAARFKEVACGVKVIFLTVHNDPDYVDATFAVGALGYVLKTRLTTDLLPAIHEVLQGGTFVPPLSGNGSNDYL